MRENDDVPIDVILFAKLAVTRRVLLNAAVGTTVILGRCISTNWLQLAKADAPIVATFGKLAVTILQPLNALLPIAVKLAEKLAVPKLVQD